MVVEAASPGQTFIEPGFFFTVQNVGGIAQGVAQQGIVGLVFQSDDGPLNTPTASQTENDFLTLFAPGGTYGSNPGTAFVRQAWKEQPNTLQAVRVGSAQTVATGTTASASPTVTSLSVNGTTLAGYAVTGAGIPANTTVLSGTSTTVTLSQNATATASAVNLTFTAQAAAWTLKLVDGTTAALTIPAAWIGVGPNSWSLTVRTTPDGLQRQFLLYGKDLSVLASVLFPIAPTTSGGHGEAGALLTALNQAALPYFGQATLVGTPGDTTTLQNLVTAAPTTAGSNPTVATSDYTNAFATLSTVTVNAVACDSTSQTVAAALQSWVDSQRSYGHFVVGMTAEPIAIARSTRYTDAKAFNDPAVGYVANGYTDASGNEDGAPAAARVAAAYAALPLGRGLTNYVIRGATGLRDPFTVPDFRTAIQSGALVFRLNETGQVAIGYGNTTFLVPNANLDAGWQKFARVKLRDWFIGTVAVTIAPLSGQFRNTPQTRRTIAWAAQRVINQGLALGLFVPPDASDAANPAINVALINTAFEDPDNPPSGDQASFKYIVKDADTLDKIYGTFGFQF